MYNPVIQVDHLTKRFGSRDAVNNLSFTVNKGDIYGFLGQNGAGKSTTIRMLLTLIKPTSGTIKIFGENLSDFRSKILTQVGAVIERPDLYKYLSAYENMFIFSKISAVPVTRKRILEQLEQVGLINRMSDKVGSFSQGMKQRLGIAVALLHDPQLVILDEPTNGLDPQGIADMRILIKNLSLQQGKTVLISSHLLSEIELIANRLLIIDQGKKMIEGTVADLVDPSRTLVELETTNNEYCFELLKQSPWSTQVQKSDASIRVTLNRNEIPELSSWVIRQDIGLMAIKPMHSLEDYFLRLTQV